VNLHVFQHVPFEGPGVIEPWARGRGQRIQVTRFFECEPLPPLEGVDWLVILGGPMSVHDEAIFPWLSSEKRFITEAIAGGRTILGICLGAQLVAAALGARVYPNAHKEVGWFPVRRRLEAERSKLGRALPLEIEAFHWHGETFDLPAGAIPLASSEACLNQGFVLGERVLGVQFHLETTPEAIGQLVANCPEDLTEGSFVQSPAAMLSAENRRFCAIHAAMASVLEVLSGVHS
jgi:GMP synthase-like glutamine amidotransferase